jgi:hypothetical protein
MSYDACIGLIEVALLIAMPLAAEAGFRAGLRRRARADDALSQVSVVQVATFGILGLLVAFAISMAEARFSARRDLILAEANAIGTTYLRSKYLLDPHPAELAPLFRRYVDARVAFYAARADVAAARREVEIAEQLQRDIWGHAVAVVRADPEHGDTVAAFVESLNEMIDLENTRVAVITMHVPASVLALIVLVALFGCATTGFEGGLEGRRVWLALIALPLLVALAICVVLDLDSPRLGVITTGQFPMTQLQQSLEDEDR